VFDFSNENDSRWLKHLLLEPPLMMICCLPCPVLARENDAAKHPDWSADGTENSESDAVVAYSNDGQLSTLHSPEKFQVIHDHEEL
jgi:hypothetical protein